MKGDIGVLWEYREWGQLWLPLPASVFASCANPLLLSAPDGASRVLHFSIVADPASFARLRAMQAVASPELGLSGPAPGTSDQIIVRLGYVSILVKPAP